jgi:hypothetical protein
MTSNTSTTGRHRDSLVNNLNDNFNLIKKDEIKKVETEKKKPKNLIDELEEIVL